ncbi:metallophosphoesterase [Marinobacter sp.]|uniref:metallophosphoesterase n=1 Tax=Marinobacter sp. TaxID=50741 RepID=UPI003A902177
MRLVCISDTHSLHTQIPPLPDGDVLVHAGDCTGSGSLPALDEFTKWFGSLPHKFKVLIAGNHDFAFERYPAWSREMCEKNDITYLQDEAVRIEGVSFYGLPWTPFFHNMGFNADQKIMTEKVALIPNDTNVLITQGPARGLFDYVHVDGVSAGCPSLQARLPHLNHLRAHICGHIHEGYGKVRKNGVTYVNAASCTERYQPTNPPIVIDI